MFRTPELASMHALKRPKILLFGKFISVDFVLAQVLEGSKTIEKRHLEEVFSCAKRVFSADLIS